MNGKCFYDAMEYYLSNKTQPFQTCLCDLGWTTQNPNDYLKCCYQKKSQFYAITLEFILGFGLGHFYVGNTSLGLLKLISSIALCCVSCSIIFCFCNIAENRSMGISYQRVPNETNDEVQIKFNLQPLRYKIFNFVLLSSVIVYILWQITDAVLFGMNLFKDGNGVELDHW